MTLGLWIGIGLFVTGVAVYVRASKPFREAYTKRHGSGPPRSWLWTSSDDPLIERWRRWVVVGSALAWVGAIVAILNPAM